MEYVNKAKTFIMANKWVSIGVAVVVVAVLIWMMMPSGENFDEVIPITSGYPDYTIRRDEQEDFQGKDDVELVIVYATWCGHCQKAKPEFEAVQRKLHDTRFKNRNLKVRLVDGDTNPELVKQYGVTGYPSIFLLKDGKQIAHEGERTEQAMEAFLNQEILS